MTRREAIWRSEYWLVLALIVASYVVCATQQTSSPSKIILLIQLATVAVTLRVAASSPAIRRVGWLVLAAAALAVMVVWIVGSRGRVIDVLLAGASMVAYMAAPIAIVLHQLRKDRVNAQTLLAAISAYLLVGMLFTFTYNFIEQVTQVPTFGGGHLDSLASQLFFSFTTLTTTGYGNLVPVGAAVQSLAIAEAIIGQLFLVVAVAGVVSRYQGLGKK